MLLTDEYIIFLTYKYLPILFTSDTKNKKKKLHSDNKLLIETLNIYIFC